MKKLLLSVVTIAATLAGFSQQLTEGFESGTFPPSGWFEYNNLVDGLDQSTVQSHTGATSAFFDDVNGTDTMILITATIPSLTAGSQLTFWEWTRYSGCCYIYHGVWASINGGAAVELSEMPSAAADGAWTEQTIDLSAYAGSSITLSFVYVGDFADEWHIDDVLVDLAPTCPDPSNLLANNLTPTSAALDWMENGSATEWQVEFDTTGYTQGTGNLRTPSIFKPYTLAGLTPNTTYDYYVRSICAPGDTSGWAGPFTFTTPCNAIVAPYTQDFEASTTSIPSCFNQGSSNVKDWEFSNSGTGEHIGNNGTIGGSTASNGYFAWVDDSSPHDTTTMLSPLFDVSGLTTPALSFYLLSNNESESNVDFSIDVYDGSAWNNDFFTNNSNTANGEWEKFVLDLSTLTITGNIQLRFIVRERNGTDFYDDIAIDDITIDELPTCLDPSAILLDSVSNDYARLDWTENGTAIEWQVQYDTAGFTPGTGILATTTTKPYGISGLTAQTDYDFYVRAVCAPGDTSLWAGPFRFMTNCDPVIGDSITDAIAITTLTYYDTNNTSECFTSQFPANSSADVFYMLVTDSCVDTLDISLCGTPFDTRLYVLESDKVTQAAFDDDGCGGAPYASEMQIYSGVEFNGGDTIYIVVDGYFGGSEGEYFLYVNQNIAANTADITYPTNVCAGATATVTNNGTTGGTYSSNGGTIDPSTGDFSSTVGGMFEIYYTVGNVTACMDMDTAMITVDTLDLSITVSNDTATATSAGTYQWIDCANGDTAVTSATMQWFKPAVSGTYAVIVTGACGSDTSACVTIATTGINTNTDLISGIYPNPTNGMFTIALTNNNSFVEILNTVGQVVYSKNTTSNITNIELNNVAKGSYMVRVTNNGTQTIEKLIIK